MVSQKERIFVKKITRWGAKYNSGGKCYIPNMYIGDYAYIKIIDKEEFEKSRKFQRLSKISFRVFTNNKDMKKREEKLQSHLNKLNKIRNEKR